MVPEPSLSGVQDARSSIVPSPGRSAIVPKLRPDDRVTVPPSCRVARSCRFSITHVHATSGSMGSSIISGSSSARTKMTHRKVPSHSSTPSGSCRSTNLPETSMASGSAMSTVMAKAAGASRAGAGASVRRNSGRGLTALICSTATSNGSPEAATDRTTSRLGDNEGVRRLPRRS